MAFMIPHHCIMTPRNFVSCWVVTRRKLQTPGNAEEHKRQETPTNTYIVLGVMILR